jgi:hypothetical protein
MKLDLSIQYDKSKAQHYFNQLLEKGAKIELKELKPKRTIQQNKYLHVCITIFANETGYTIEEAKTLLKRTFGRFMLYEKKGDKYLRSTADLDTREESEFIDFIRTFASQEAGIYIPTSEEYLRDQFAIDKSIESVF